MSELNQAEDIKQLTDEQFDKTMKTNVYGTFYMTREAMKYLKRDRKSVV